MSKTCISRYDLLSVTPTRDFVAIWFHDDDKGIRLVAKPLDAIGVAGETEIYLEDGKKVSEDDAGTCVVGLMITDGYFEIAQSCSNFAGMCRQGDDIAGSIGCLKSDYLHKWKQSGRTVFPYNPSPLEIPCPSTDPPVLKSSPCLPK